MGLWQDFLIASVVVLILSSLIYGWKFLRKGNVLLGLEWLVITVSASNMMVFLFNSATIPLNISIFLDQFSRAVGIPVIVPVGVMAVTHRYKPPVWVDVLLFGIGALVGGLFAFTGFAASIKPYLLLGAWTLFSVFLAYFAKRLWDAGERVQSINVIAVLVTNQIIATIYDFYHLPGDDELHTKFYTFALVVWAYLLVGTYYAYCALERAGGRRPAVT